MAEAYYFNPKQVKRKQLVRLVELMQKNLGSSQKNNISIQDDSESKDAGRKKNFFERKRFVNYSENVGVGDSSPEKETETVSHPFDNRRKRRSPL